MRILCTTSTTRMWMIILRERAMMLCGTLVYNLEWPPAKLRSPAARMTRQFFSTKRINSTGCVRSNPQSLDDSISGNVFFVSKAPDSNCICLCLPIAGKQRSKTSCKSSSRHTTAGMLYEQKWWMSQSSPFRGRLIVRMFEIITWKCMHYNEIPESTVQKLRARPFPAAAFWKLSIRDKGFRSYIELLYTSRFYWNKNSLLFSRGTETYREKDGKKYYRHAHSLVCFRCLWSWGRCWA